MQEIIKQEGPSRQLFETINFAFMKIFYFLVKIAVFRASLFFSGDSRHALRVHLIWKVTYDMNPPKIGEMPQK